MNTYKSGRVLVVIGKEPRGLSLWASKNDFVVKSSNGADDLFSILRLMEENAEERYDLSDSLSNASSYGHALVACDVATACEKIRYFNIAVPQQKSFLGFKSAVTDVSIYNSVID